jgi:DNA-directed RNA polymerase beta subunit
MPKLVKKQTPAAAAAATPEEYPSYENMNPRYAQYPIPTAATAAHDAAHDDSTDAVDIPLSQKITSRIGTYIEEPWSLIGSYFQGKHLDQLVRHQIESYNDMVNVQLKRTVDMFNPVRIVSDQDYDKEIQKHRLEVEVTFSNLYLYRPQIHENTGATKIMFPQEARLRNFTYAAMMTVDMNIKYIVRTGANQQTIIHKSFPKVQIGKLPIMLRIDAAQPSRPQCDRRVPTRRRRVFHHQRQ